MSQWAENALKRQIRAFQVYVKRKKEHLRGAPESIHSRIYIETIHKREPVLGKEQFDVFFFGGGAENRTPVHTKPSSKHYKLSRCFGFSISKPIDRPLKYLAGSIFFLRIPATPQEAFL